VLAELRPIPRERWTARFRCVIALANPAGAIHFVEDTVEGQISDTPRGDHGFGYDPIFFVPAYNKTMAELSPAQKNQISHRGKAARQARALLLTLLTRQD
jgi:XTP/dITP diphosphohydrolase